MGKNKAITALFIITFFALTAGCGSSASDEDAENISSRLKRLETRVAAIEFNSDAFNERDKRFERFMADSERRQADLMKAISKIEEQLRTGVAKTDKAVVPDTVGAVATPAGSETKTGTAAEQSGYHEVQKGDTVYSISRQYSLEAADLRKMNSLESDTIVPGQKLRIR